MGQGERWEGRRWVVDVWLMVVRVLEQRRCRKSGGEEALKLVYVV